MAMGEKYLLYDSQAAGGNDEQKSLIGGNATWLWNDRLLLVEHSDNDDESESDNEYATNSEHKKSDSEFWRFTALDLITNEARPVHFQKSDIKFHQVEVVLLSKDYGFVVESDDDSFCVNLVKLNWAPGEFQLIARIDQPYEFDGILVDNLNPAKFVLQYFNDNDDYIHQACTLESGKIKLGDTYDFVDYDHYFNDTLFSFDSDEIDTYNLTTAEAKNFEIEEIDDGEIDFWRVEWVKERLYAAVYFDDTETCGIVYTDLKTLTWNLLDLTTNLRINKMQFFNGNLIVYAANNDDYYDDIDYFKFKTYSIPINRPQSLRKMAWSHVVQALKRDELIIDPYNAAAQFLPYNCDLRAPWYKDETALEMLGKANNGQSQSKASKSNLSQESPDGVSSKRGKFN